MSRRRRAGAAAAVAAVAVAAPAPATPSQVATPRTQMVSANRHGHAANGTSSQPSISADGKLVAFTTTAPNAFAGGVSGMASQVVLTDLTTGSHALVSSAIGGGPADGASDSPALSGDGGTVAFVSSADNLVAGDGDGVADVFVRRADGTIVRVSQPSDGSRPDGPSSDPAISANGQFVAFASAASNLVPGDTNGVQDVFVADLAAHTVQRVSLAADGSQANAASQEPAISADGQTVSFSSTASNLVPGDTDAVEDVFVRDLPTSTTRLVSVSSSGAQQNAAVQAPFHQVSSVSGDGRYVVFDSNATNLVRGDVNRHTDVFVRDLGRGTTAVVSLSSGNVEGDNDSFFPTITPDGRHVAFESLASNLAPGDGAREDVFVRDLTTKETSIVDVPAGRGHKRQELVPQLLQRPVLSADGYAAAFSSTAPGLVVHDGNGAEDVFVRDMTPVTGHLAGRRRALHGRARLKFSAADPAATSFLCRLPRRAAFACPAGRWFRLPRLAPGTHRLRAYAGGPGLLYQPKPLVVTVRIPARAVRRHGGH